MGYYTIRLFPASQDMTTIVTEFGKLRYNRLPMGICASGDILQAKVYEMLGDIEGVKKYIEGISVSIKESFSKHIEQLIIIFGRLRAPGLKVNAPKYILGLNSIPYLVYVIKRKGIKQDPKKVKGIMYPGRPTTKAEARAIIRMLQ